MLTEDVFLCHKTAPGLFAVILKSVWKQVTCWFTKRKKMNIFFLSVHLLDGVNFITCMSMVVCNHKTAIYLTKASQTNKSGENI
jgi:hypothetical protein